MTEKWSSTPMNVFDVTFMVLLINKLAGVAPIDGWSWWRVFIPLILQCIIVFILAMLNTLCDMDDGDSGEDD